jgi:hypothetical protein
LLHLLLIECTLLLTQLATEFQVHERNWPLLWIYYQLHFLFSSVTAVILQFPPFFSSADLHLLVQSLNLFLQILGETNNGYIWESKFCNKYHQGSCSSFCVNSSLAL